MKSIFNKSDNNKIIDRINKLTPETKALWGKMNVSQMLAHCQPPIQVAFGALKLKRGLAGILFGKMAKKQMLTTEFKHGLPTDKFFLIKEQKNFNDEKKKLIELIARFNGGTNVIIGYTHPFFGKMTLEEWDVLMWKHLDHHIRQFGG